MRLRTILKYCIAITGTGFGVAARAQETPAKRLGSIAAVAVAEYRLGVDPRGTLLSNTELGEARDFLADAKTVAGNLTGANAAAIRTAVDALVRASERAVSSTTMDSLYASLVTALGADAGIDPPPAHLDIAEGRKLFEANCAQCHGRAGFGDGADASHYNPPPAALAGPASRYIDADLMYRVVSVGVKGTAMAAWSATLTPTQRWNVVAYAGSLRNSAATATSGIAAERALDSVRTRVTDALNAALAAASGARRTEASDRAFDAYAAFEPIETAVRARDDAFVTSLESEFLAFRTAIRSGDIAGATAARDRVVGALPRALSLAGSSSGSVSAFASSFLIIVREGFEAILIISAIVAMLVRTGNAARVREVWLGTLLAIVASILSAFILSTALRTLTTAREVIEGVTMLVAVAVLFSVSYWILSKVESDRWQAFIRGKVSAAMAGGGRAALVGVAFLVVYREGAETVLFYQALLQQSAHAAAPVLGGLAVGGVVLSGIYFAFHRFGVRVALRPFFAVTGSLLYLMAFVFIGKGLRELQEGGALSVTPLSGAPHLDALGIFPTVETLAGQWLMLGLFVLGCWHTFVTPRLQAPRISPAVPAPASDEPASTTPRTPRTQARSSVPS